MTTENLFDVSRRLIPSGVNSPVRYFEPRPFFTERADKGHMWDTDGRQLIDCCNGYGALLLGHRHPVIISAVTKQLESGTLYCTPTQNETRLAGLITRYYSSIDKVRLVNTGGEATMTAVRLARGHTGRRKIVMFDGCYHGAHDSLLVKRDKDAQGIPSSEGIPPQISSHTIVSKYNDIEEISTILETDDDIAGVIVEPVAGNMGLVLPALDFLPTLRKITQKRDIVLIFDEVITGFRLGLGGAQEYFDITPDITTLGKALGGGFGIAAVGGREEIMDKLSPGGQIYSASTFAGNPIATSAAISAVNFMSTNNDMYSTLSDRAHTLAKAIGDIADDLHIPHQINQISSMLQIFFTNEPVIDRASANTSDTKKFKQLFDSLLRSGVFVAPSQFEVLFLSLAHTSLDLEKIQDAYSVALKEMIS